LDLDYLLALECGLKFNREFDVNLVPRAYVSVPPVRIGVARDAAFSFYYEDNLDLLRQNGAVIVPFSPTQDASLPPGLGALYLGGGYPELYAQQLSANTGMLASVKDFAASGRPVYAECGGMIYLSQQLTTTDGLVYPMANVLPLATVVTERLVRFGYVEVELTQDCLLGPCGTILRGHSFHYSRIAHKPDLATSYRVQYSLSGEQQDEGYRIGNVLASYIHLHFGAAPSAARHLVEAARRAQTMPSVPA
jgi:cobyrinic acid a,c-diamide synthase